MLADSNSPKVKVVLLAKAAAESRPPRVATSDAETCEGELQLSFDVRGILVRPRNSRIRARDLTPGPFVATGATEELLTGWDTVCIDVCAPLPGGQELEPEAPRPEPALNFKFLRKPSVPPPGSEPGVALELCSRAMLAIQSFSRKACAVVQWASDFEAGATRQGQGQAGSQNSIHKRFVVTLAELDVASGNGVRLLNTESVAIEAKVRDQWINHWQARRSDVRLVVIFSGGGRSRQL